MKVWKLLIVLLIPLVFSFRLHNVSNCFHIFGHGLFDVAKMGLIRGSHHLPKSISFF